MHIFLHKKPQSGAWHLLSQDSRTQTSSTALKPRVQFVCRHSNSVHRHKINWAAISTPAAPHSGMLQKHNSNRGQRTRVRAVEFAVKAGAVQLQFFQDSLASCNPRSTQKVPCGAAAQQRCCEQRRPGLCAHCRTHQGPQTCHFWSQADYFRKLLDL